MSDPVILPSSSAQAQDDNNSVVKAAGLIGAATFSSRVLGFIRDMVLARLFGATPAADAFFVAYRIPNLLRELFAEGSMSSAFIPVFTEYHMLRTKRDAWELAALLRDCDRVRIGGPDLARAYSARRRLDRGGGILFTDLLVRLFSNELAALRLARSLGLAALGVVPPARDFLARRMIFGARG